MYLTLENVLLNHQDSFKTKSTLKSSKKTPSHPSSSTKKSGEGISKISNLKQDGNSSLELEKSKDDLSKKDMSQPLMSARGERTSEMEFDRSARNSEKKFDLGIIKD